MSDVGPIHFWDRFRQPQGTLLALGKEGHWLAINPEGNYRGSEGIDKYLSVVVQSPSGQDTLSLEQFKTKYGWNNEPERVRIGEH